MSKDVILGIDTSAYRTSLCLLDLNGEIVEEQKKLLTVKEGSRGLQPSAAVFQHVQQLPELARRFSWDGLRLIAVAASVKPRPVADSYMPVFKVGESWGRGIALSHSIPFIETSHQEMHIAAGEFSAEDRPKQSRFLAFHLSGGTSELLVCERTDHGYAIEKLGGTLDLHAGQLIDRVGVALGLPFPAGPYLEQLANEPHDDAFQVPTTMKGYDFYLSGAETQLLRAIEQKRYSAAAVARAAERCVARSLEKSIRRAAERGYPKEVLIVGGVAANRYIKSRLKERLEHRAVGCRLYFAEPRHSGDNAFGVACIGRKVWQNQYARR